MANPFIHYNPGTSNPTEVQYDPDETSDEDFRATRNASAFPFFETSDPVLRAAYSYGDPRGGRYPDPTIHQLRPSTPPEEFLTTNARVQVFEDEDDDSEPLLVPDDPELDPDFDISEVEDEEMSQDDLSPDKLDVEFDVAVRQSPQKVPRGRGRGRGRGQLRGRGGTRGHGSVKAAARTSTRGRRGGGRSRGKAGAKKGPRAHAEPTLEFKRLNGMLTEAFLREDLDAALAYGLQAIQVNPEIFPVHGTIAEILVRKGRIDDALGALFVGAHATRDPDAWRYVIEQLLEIGDNTKETRQRLQDCYSMLLDMNSEDYAARLGRMKNYRKAGQNMRAKNECHNLLKRDPYDTDVLNHLAEACFALGQPEAALPAYEGFVNHCLEHDQPDESNLDWVFLDYYADMLIQLQQWDPALKMITIVSRWLLGRPEETFWNFDKDDREWDAEDEPRRIKVHAFTPGKHPLSSYGQGLLVELREKIGLARLGKGSGHIKEALHHFEFLEPEDEAEDAYIVEYPDLFREVGDALREAGLHQEALRFYEPLKKRPEALDSRFCFDLAICYQTLGREEDYKNSLQIFKRNARDPQYHIGLAKLYQSQGKEDDMWHLIKQLKRLGKSDLIRNAGLPLVRPGGVSGEPQPADNATRRSDATPPIRHSSEDQGAKRRYANQAKIRREREQHNHQQDMIIGSLWNDLKALEKDVDAGDLDAEAEWLGIANEVFDEFREQPVFFPRDRHNKFVGYTRSRRTVVLPDDDQLFASEVVKDEEVPVHYRNIHFDDWLDLMLQLALRYAKKGNRESCWDVINVAENANVILHDQPRIVLTRNAAMACALILQDDQRLTEEARWFMKHFPFVTETYRLFAAVNRFCRGDVSYFNSGPEQKFTLRAVKLMDFALLPAEHRLTFLFTDGDRVKWSHPGKDGNPHKLTEHDPTLLVLYGHMMFVATTYVSALTYYFRAYVLRPEDPVLNLCIAISYMQMGYKRQADNRQFQIQQGLSFMHRYYDLRTRNAIAIHMQEAELNMAIMWHSLGLLHLAVPNYERCLELSERVRVEQKSTGGEREVKSSENFAAEAAFGLQTILATGGDFDGARRITEDWLVL